MSFDGPLFIVGMPRSGTKLLRELLNRHPRIAIPGVETEFLPWLAAHLGSFGDLRDPTRFDAFFASISRHTYFELRRREGAVFDAVRWHGTCRDFTPAGVFEALIRLEVGAPVGSGRIWGDKSPSYVDDLALIKRLYPSAKVIHIVRDVRDYCLSIHKAWGKNMPRAAQRWADGVVAARQAGTALGDDYQELHYEDLVTSTESTLRALCVRMGIDFDPRMLTLDKPSENLGNARGMSHVVSDNHGAYARLMSRDVLARIEEIAGDELIASGYALALPARPRRRLSRFEMLTAQLGDGWKLARRVHDGSTFFKTALFHLRYFLTTRA